MPYFLISGDEDGDVRMKQINPQEFLSELAKGDYGDSPKFFDHIPDQDIQQWVGHMIIKGEIVVPKPVDKVVEYTL